MRTVEKALRASLLLLSAAVSMAAEMTVAADTPRRVRYTGVNIATGGFAPDHIPGKYGYDYFYPTREEAAPFVTSGMNVVRVPIIWERLQPEAFGPLDRQELDRIDAGFAALQDFEMIVLDIHNYAAFRGERLDKASRGAAMLADLWTKLATKYRGDPKIAFGLMNEPNGMTALAWRPIAEASLTAIRKTGARNLVLVPGTHWSGAHNWTEGGAASNGSALASLRDPADNMAFEMHQYADADSSGTKIGCIPADQAAARLTAATAWLRANHARGFLGEFGTDPDPGCLAALEAMLAAMDAAPDAWMGWTYWAAGAMWGGYPKSIQPDAKGAKPQSAVLARHVHK